MAESIEFEPRKYDPKQALYVRLQNVSYEHAESLTDLLEILDLLREKGILELVKGALGSGEQLMMILTKTIEGEGAVSLLRNLTILAKLLGGMNPEILEEVVGVLSKDSDKARKSEKPSGILGLLAQLTTRDSRRFIGSLTDVVETLGKHLKDANTPARGKKHRRVTRHEG